MCIEAKRAILTAVMKYVLNETDHGQITMVAPSSEQISNFGVCGNVIHQVVKHNEVSDVSVQETVLAEIV